MGQIKDLTEKKKTSVSDNDVGDSLFLQIKKV